MVRLIYAALTSLDGCAADAKGNFDWAAPDAEVHTLVSEFEQPIGGPTAVAVGDEGALFEVESQQRCRSNAALTADQPAECVRDGTSDPARCAAKLHAPGQPQSIRSATNTRSAPKTIVSHGALAR